MAEATRLALRFLRHRGHEVLVFHLLDPGEREAYEEAPGVTGAVAAREAPSFRPSYYREPAEGDAPMAPLPFVQREMPPIGETPQLDFPDVRRARLSNGISATGASPAPGRCSRAFA